jgi:hypothetical protein
VAKALLLEEGIAACERRVEYDFGDGRLAMGRNVLFEVWVGGAQCCEDVPFERVALHFIQSVPKVVHR